ncbi:serine hydrolase domain-containing protein [Qipengyuania aquimaris]|uniref:serine hydrolase domain-containing protein n=1 Tax=Qipengyuania aquimaris TaxID=255984 RepID=UPI001FCF9FF1|nr:serine hydrolase domain-containing protein [Qipengyuania aquimaris]UOR16001.1 beta-lactamase family protein [Qipengyuania aquimaris]
MTLRWALVALTFLAPGLSASSASSGIDNFIEAELPNSAAPGIAYAQYEDGKVIVKGFGEKAQGTDERVTRDTPFPIGSVTKSFTALAIMQMIEAGELALDDPVSQHLPAFAGGQASRVTLRQLLNHTSGYSTVQGNSHHGSADASQVDLIEYANRLALVEPEYAPGTRWEYSNANYQILGAMIERATGQSYAGYIEARIFKPLGMEHSAVVVGSPPDSQVTGHRPWFGGVRAAPAGEGYAINAPAGGIVSSASDMGRYLAMWLSGEDDVVSAETKAAMMAPSSPASPLYGLGWSIDPARGTVYHTGLVPGGETLASFSPTEGKGVVVMVNANGGLGFADTWYLIGGAGARAMGQAHEDDGSRLGPKVAYLSIALLPPLFLLLALVSWKGRSALRGKRGSTQGKLSLWLPAVAMTGLAWFLMEILPQLFGGSIATLRLYQPDFALCLIAAAILAPAWAILRLALAYSGKREPEPAG